MSDGIPLWYKSLQYAITGRVPLSRPSSSIDVILCAVSQAKTQTRAGKDREFSHSAAAETPAAEEPEDRHDDDSGNGAAKDVYYVLADWGALV